MGQFDHLNNVIPINLKFGMHSDIEGSGRSKITAGDFVIGIHDDTSASLYFATGNNGSYKAAIMPPPGVGMLCGFDYNSSPIYAAPVFNTNYSAENATVSFYGIPTYESDNTLHYGTAFLATSTIIEGATETQAGLITAQTTQSFSGNKTFRGYGSTVNEILYGPGADGDIARKSGITIYNNDFLKGLNTSNFVSGDLAPQIHFEWLEHQAISLKDAQGKKETFAFGTMMYDIEQTADSKYQGIFKFLYPYAKRRMTVDANLRTNKISLTPEESVMYDSPSILPDNRNRSDYGSFAVYDGSAVLTLGGKNNSAKATDPSHGDGQIKLFSNNGYSVSIFHDENKYSRSGDLYLELPTHTGNGALVTMKPKGSGIWPDSGEVTGIIPFFCSDMQITSDYGGSPWVGSQLSWYRSLRMRWRQRAEDDTKYDLGSSIIEIGGQEWEEKAQYARNTKGEIYLHLGSYRDRSTHELICDKIFKIKPPKDYQGSIHKNDVTLYLPDQVLANKLYYFDIDNGQLVSSNTYINNNKIAINSTSEPTENLYVNGDAYFYKIIANNGNKHIDEEDYANDCKQDLAIRIDSHISKENGYNNNFTALPPYSNNANTLVTINRHTGAYVTQIGLTNKGIFYRTVDNDTETLLSQTDKWNQLIYRKVNSGSYGDGTATGSTQQPIYIKANGEISVCNGVALGKNASGSGYSAAGWYRIATSNIHIVNCSGTFEIVGTGTGRHTTTIITAATSYGKNPIIQALQTSSYSTAAITKARIVYHSTAYNNNYAYLEIYCNPITSAPISITTSCFGGTGWNLLTTPQKVDTIPSGYTSKIINLPNKTIMADRLSLSNNIYSEYGITTGSDTQLVYNEFNGCTSFGAWSDYINDPESFNEEYVDSWLPFYLYDKLEVNGKTYLYDTLSINNTTLIDDSNKLTDVFLPKLLVDSNNNAIDTRLVAINNSNPTTSQLRPIRVVDGIIQECPEIGSYVLNQGSSTMGTYQITGGVPHVGIGNDCTFEIGQYIDFHVNGSPSGDFDLRIQAKPATSTGATAHGSTLTLPQGNDGEFVITAGNQTIGGNKTFSGSIILKSDVTYGTERPEDIYTSTNPATEGQIYFKIIS